MKVSLGLPTHRVEQGVELVSGPAIGELSAAAEGAGFDAVYVTEHPFPSTEWLDSGGHHALDPLVALSFAAAATRTIRLHTNLFVAAYRNPFLAAKGLSTLDVLSGGRLLVGVGAGYLEAEYDALGGSYASRNDDTDAAIAAWRTAWTGESVVADGHGWAAAGNTMLPRPAQQPGPPIWIGGNSKRAIRRAVELADGWSPFPTSPAVASATRTAALRTPDDLAGRLDYAREYAASIGRTGPFDVAFIPRGLRMGSDEPVDPDVVLASCRALAAVGVNWITISFAAGTRAGQLAQIATWADDVLPALAQIESAPVLPS